MSGLVCVLDANNQPLMPMAAAHARRLLQRQKATRIPHHALMIIRLPHAVMQPDRQPIVAAITVQSLLAVIELSVVHGQQTRPLCRVWIDLRSDLGPRLRRRAGHRRRRRQRRRYRRILRHGVPFALRRPTMRRSVWRSQHRGIVLSERRRIPRLVQWRGQAIMRVLTSLSCWLPITACAIRPTTGALFPAQVQRADLRNSLSARDSGYAEGPVLTERCDYCGSERGPFEIDHRWPRSRSGSNHIHNLVLACRRCNQRKAAQPAIHAPTPRTSLPYLVAQTVQHLQICVRTAGWVCDAPVPPWPESSVPQWIAKPVARRPRAQRFSSRNYPLTTALRAGMVRSKTTIKRAIRVNRGLLRRTVNQRTAVRVIPFSGTWSPDLIQIGMLIEGLCAGQLVRGWIAAITSGGAVRIRVPTQIARGRIEWQTVSVSARQPLRVLSRSGVLFFRCSDREVLV